ncbi:MAG: carboxylesterase [Pseudozobellia sp.]|nr:carboxylesterase [Pseudozobellia sp.]MBG48763.1 carboxylesterase [Pseudozobellia sp.]|tara:strand:- start:134496 stop:136106 length:1611 start_codon:yes stop_codon:yes gene_type:complete
MIGKNLIIFLTFLGCLCLNAQQVDTPIVTIGSGSVRGKKENGVDSFKGIPYAASPTGEFRWRPPQAVMPWQGIFDATEFGSNCAQSGWGGAPGTISENSSEDCLYLNLWRPSDRVTDEKLPVMVWIHGGAFVFGGGGSADSNGAEFAKQGVILVTFNYRLGRLGHFAFPALTEEFPDEPKGSYAYMDQIAALKWIHSNIAQFGGDPKNVTIFGESAGGVSVHSLLTMPTAKGLFQKAIIESGGGRDGVLTGRPIDKENADPYYPVSAETIGINFAKKHQIEGTDKNALAKLRALPVEQIVDGGQETDGQGGPSIYSGPILDGVLVIETAETAYKKGNQSKVPIIIGSNSAEVPSGFVNASSKEELFKLFGTYEKQAKSVLDPNGDKPLEELLTMVNTDKVWAEPARFTANAFREIGRPAYVYHFSYVTKTMRDNLKYGAPHASEIAYVFNNLGARWGNPEKTNEDIDVAKALNTYWANFAKTGNPNGAGLTQWPVYDSEETQLLEIERNGSRVAKKDPKKERLDIIQKAVEARELH